MGIHIESAYNGADALAAIHSKHFDLILMDLQMPIMDGYEATQKIRAWEAGKSHVPIIALSAMILDNEYQLCLDTGMDGCIVKPFNTEQLFQIIESHVGKTTSAHNILEMKHEDANIFLDIQAALPRFGNDVQVYQEFLMEFSKCYQKGWSNLEQRLTPVTSTHCQKMPIILKVWQPAWEQCNFRKSLLFWNSRAEVMNLGILEKHWQNAPRISLCFRIMQ